MCLFLYSPHNTLKLDYISETIFLDHDGSSGVIIDILLTSKSDAPLSQVYALYPNRFSIFDENVQSLRDTGNWEDLSYSFIDDNHFSNWVYNQPGSALKKQSPPADLFKLETHDVPLMIQAPNPAVPYKNIEYYGVISGKVTIQPVGGLEEPEWMILQDLGFTIFNIEFDIPLQSNKPRWLRWFFSNDTCIVNGPLTKWDFRKKWFMDRVYYYYDIFGPFDVRRRFINYLNGYKTDCLRRPELSHHIPWVTNLIEKFINNGVSENISTTYAPDWRIHVIPFSDRLSRLTDFYGEGSIEISGGLPNFVNLNLDGTEKPYPVYEWKTKTLNEIEALKTITENPEEILEIEEKLRQKPFSFSIKFQAKYMNGFTPWIPYIALGLSLFGVILAITRFF